MKYSLLLAACAFTAWPHCAAFAAEPPKPAQPFKLHDALDLPDWLTLRGDFRARYETLSRQFRPGLTGSDQGLFLRTNLFAEAKFSPFRIGAELIDSRSYLTDTGSGVTADDVNAAELVQAYGAVSLKGALTSGDKLDAQFGRFTMNLGSARLAGRHAFRNTTNAFTGLRVDWTDSKNIEATLFYTLPHTRLPNDRDSVLNNKVVFDTETFDLTFWGALLRRKNLPFHSSGEIFLFAIDEQDGRFQTTDREFYTPGARILRPPASRAWDFEIEGGVQRGTARSSVNPANIRDLSVRAAYVHATLGYTWGSALKPRLALIYDYGSGDADPNDGISGRFDGLFGPRRADFGPRGLLNDVPVGNITSPAVRLEIAPNPRLSGALFYRALLLAQARDAFAAGIRDPSGQSGRFAGHQLEITGRYWLIPNTLRLDAGGVALLDANFERNAPNGRDVAPLFAFAEMAVSF